MFETPLVRRAGMVMTLGSIVACGLPPDADDAGEASTGELDGGSTEPASTGPVISTTAADGDGEASTSPDPSATSSGADTDASSTGEPGSTSEAGNTDDGTTTDDSDGESSTGDAPLDCSALAVECAGFGPGALVMFELDTGAVTGTVPVFGLGGPSNHSIAWVDDAVYTCTGDGGTLHRIDVLTGEITNSGLTCSGVTEVQGQLLVRRESVFPAEYARYADFDAVVADDPLDVTDYPPNVERFTATDEVLISAWHSTNAFDTFDLVTAAPVDNVVLESYDDWILGMDVVGGQLVINTWFSNPLRHIAFDLATGQRTCELPDLGPPLDLLDGLACRTTSSGPKEPPPPPIPE